MYLAFIDESGTIHESNTQNNHYVLTAVVMQEKGMKFLHQKTQKLKKEIWKIVQGSKKQMPIQFELHMQEIKDSKGFFKPLRGKKDTTEHILRFIYSFIQALYVKIISIIIVKDKFFEIYDHDPEELLKWALKLLIERINRYVWGESKNDKEYALLIMDQDFALDKKKRNFISEMMELGVKYSNIDVDRVLDTPIILKSEFHNGIQIVDSVAFLIHRYTRKKLEGNVFALFDELSDEFISNLTWKFCGGAPSSFNESGLKFFPSNYTPSSSYWDAFSK